MAGRINSCASSSVLIMQERLEFLRDKRSPAIVHDHPGF
jgi:hypothetical protein